MKKIFIVHGWGGRPNEPWLAWLKKELENRGMAVVVPEMPDPENPKIEAWVLHLSQVVGLPDANTCFVGHSIGCQTILRYLQTLNTQVGQVVFVAPWFSLKEDSYESDEERAIAKP